MDYKEIVQKIDEVLLSVDSRTEQVNKKIEIYSQQIKKRKKGKDKRKYQYELERDNYNNLKCNNELKKINLFKQRCNNYKNYLSYIEQNDLINIKKSEYDFIKTLQEETILYFESKEEELKQRAVLERICEKDITSIGKIISLEKKRDEKYDMFLNDEFYLEEDKLYTLTYLNYDVNEVTDIVYESEKTRKAS